ncbi:MAG: PadR family transcriptional regulator [Thermoanaerobaculia bacterium]|nr:PadR family transcriptional regulator [Thermoanaerobaculia bacterium]
MKERSPTTLEYALLGLVRQVPRSGYDLRKIFEETALGSYSGSPGAIYPALRRLEKQGLIEGEIDATTTLRPRKVFRPTKAGTEVLHGWLSAKIEREDVERRVDELMLRFAFHGLLDSAVETRHFLERFLEETERYVETLKAEREGIPEEAPPHPRLALSAGIGQYQAWARWARHALKSFMEVEDE